MELTFLIYILQVFRTPVGSFAPLSIRICFVELRCICLLLVIHFFSIWFLAKFLSVVFFLLYTYLVDSLFFAFRSFLLCRSPAKPEIFRSPRVVKLLIRTCCYKVSMWRVDLFFFSFFLSRRMFCERVLRCPSSSPGRPPSHVHFHTRFSPCSFFF